MRAWLLHLEFCLWNIYKKACIIEGTLKTPLEDLWTKCIQMHSNALPWLQFDGHLSWWTVDGLNTFLIVWVQLYVNITEFLLIFINKGDIKSSQRQTLCYVHDDRRSIREIIYKSFFYHVVILSNREFDPHECWMSRDRRILTSQPETNVVQMTVHVQSVLRTQAELSDPYV